MDRKEAWGSLSEDLMFIGITGGIASGKSEFAAEIEKLGGFVIDADKIGKEILSPGSGINKNIVAIFGEKVLSNDGAIDRGALADVIFSDPSAKERLDQITHPLIFNEIVEKARRYNQKRNEKPPIVFVDSALIVDTGIANVFDVLVVIISDEKTRVKRLVEKKGYSETEARNRIKSQVNDAQRLIHADIVVENDSVLEELKSSAAEVWTGLLKNMSGC